MNKLSILILSVLLSNLMNAQTGSISAEMLKEIKKSYNSNEPATRALTNAVTGNEIKKLALSNEKNGKLDDFFKYKVSVKGITNQKSSGRCWMFTSMNIMRPKMIEKYNLPAFEYSTNYLYFWDILEKANLFLETAIKTATLPMDSREVVTIFSSPVGDGGVWNSYVNLVEKYGLVPKEAMPETFQSEKTSPMNSIINLKLRQEALKLRELVNAKKGNIEKAKTESLGAIYRILAISLGEPPMEFVWRYKTNSGEIKEQKFTPQEFAKQTLDINFDDYVMLMDDPTRDYYKLYEIENDRNVMEGINWKYINLPANEIKPFAQASIKANDAMYFSCDVGKDLNSEVGRSDVGNYDYSALFGVEFGMTKAQRILSRESTSTHGMALVGFDTDANEKTTKWLVENSWGKTSGADGYIIMTDKWFDEYMFRVVINKKYIDAKILEILKQKSVLLPPWDPMFQSDN